MSDGTPSKSPILPQELFDKIIDELTTNAGPGGLTDRAALLACALVCRSFYTRATFYIFSTIRIVDKGPGMHFHPWLTEHIATLSNILVANPVIARHTHSVAVVSRSPPPLANRDHEPSPVFKSPHLPAILSQLANIRSFHLTNRFIKIDWARYSNPLQSSITTIIQSPILTTLHLQGIRGIPLSLLGPCTNLKVLSLACIRSVLDHTNTSFHPYYSDDTSQISPPPFHASFLLESASIKEAAAFIIPLIHCATVGHKIFGQLSHLSAHLNQPVDIWSSAKVARQATNSLVSLELLDVDDNCYLASSVQINLANLRAIRALKIHTMIYPQYGDPFPNFLFSLLEPSYPTTTLETLDIRLEWEALVGEFDPFFLQPQHGWTALDSRLSNEKYPSLRSITIQLEMGYLWTEESLAGITGKTSKKIHPYLPGLLPGTAERFGDGLKYIVRPFLSRDSSRCGQDVGYYS